MWKEGVRRGGVEGRVRGGGREGYMIRASEDMR